MSTYDPDGRVDLRGFAGSMSVYAAVVAAAATAWRSGGRDLPERYDLRDVVVGGVAVHKFTRIVAKGSVTAPLRAPFTEFDGPSGPAEHAERARDGHGVRHTVGELLTCPFCLGVWVGTAYVAGLVGAPRVTRAWAAAFAVVGLSDWLQLGYGRLQR